MAATEKKPVSIPRCDRCGARSKVVAILPNTQYLYFCQHHADQHQAKLNELGAIIAEPQIQQ